VVGRRLRGTLAAGLAEHRLAAIGIGAAGLVAVALSYTELTRYVIWIRFGGLGLLLGAGLLYLRDSTLVLWRDVKRAMAAATQPAERGHLLALGLLVALGLAVRLAFVSGPMHYGESETFLEYATQPLESSMSNYSDPGNHLLHTFFLHVAWRLFGDDPWVVRLPALIPGVALIPTLYVAVRALYDKHVALLAAGLAVPSGALVLYSVNSRGYSFLCLAFLLILALGAYLVRRPNPAGWLIWSAIAALGLYALPLMIYPVAIVMTWLALVVAFDVPRERRLVVIKPMLGMIAAAVAGLLLYASVLGQRGWPHGWGPSKGLVDRVWESWNFLLPVPLQAALVVGVVASLVLHRRVARSRVPVIAGVLAVPPLVLVTSTVPSYPWMWLFLLPLYLALAAAGLIALVRLVIPRRVAAAMASAVALSAALALSIALDHAGLPIISRERPLRNGDDVARFLEDHWRPGTPLVVEPYTAPMLRYYLHHRGLDTGVVAGVRPRPGVTSRAVLLVADARRETLSGSLRRLGLAREARRRPPRLLKRYPSAQLYELYY
jgi:hypothetical protein